MIEFDVESMDFSEGLLVMGCIELFGEVLSKDVLDFGL